MVSFERLRPLSAKDREIPPIAPEIVEILSPDYRQKDVDKSPCTTTARSRSRRSTSTTLRASVFSMNASRRFSACRSGRDEPLTRFYNFGFSPRPARSGAAFVGAFAAPNAPARRIWSGGDGMSNVAPRKSQGKPLDKSRSV
jgi:hypothetical protein